MPYKDPERKRQRAKEYRLEHLEQMRERGRLRYVANPEPAKEYARQYRAIYPEKVKKCQVEHYIANQERVCEHVKNYRLANPELIKERKKKYRITHSEQINEYMRKYKKKYHAAHPEQSREYRRRRRAFKLQAGGNGITIDEWEIILDKYGNRCLACGAEGKLTLDHVVPLVKGGAHDITNAQPLCGSCNCKKGTKTIDYRNGEMKNGYTISTRI